MELSFIGIGSAFSDDINNSAYIKYKNNMLLIDCGETVFNEIKRRGLVENVDNLLIEGNFCTELHAVKNDIYKISDTNVNYNEYTPTSKCNQMNNLKIGLISYDEAVMAGLSYTSFYNNSNYLVNGINKNTWTLSPAGVNSYSNDKFVWKISDNGSVIEANVSNNSNSIRPVINIKPTLNITGNGTIDDPYIFSE